MGRQEQPKTGANGEDTHNIRKTKVTNLTDIKQNVAKLVYLVTQVPT